ncbi:hypothetical protein NQZ68_019222 [Dissostichus eleginoides]|nr:hypothetical protein NQZ68_019222 [Dissostichus eleginoides]
MAAGSSGAVAAIYLCMIVLNVKPLCSYTTHLAPMVKQHVEDRSLSAPATSLNIKRFGHDIHPCPGSGVVSIDLTAGGPAAELHAPSVGFRRGWLAEQLAPPAGLCGLALTAADLAAGPLPTPSEDYGSAPRAGGRAAEIHTPPAGFRGGRIASTPSENCGSAPRASGLAAEILAPPDTTGLASEEAG